MTGTTGGIGGLPPTPAAECQPGQEDCAVVHSATGWCSAATGQPVILLTRIPCDDTDPTIITLDASTGAPIANGPVVPCGEKDWEVSTLCDVDPITGQVIATVIQIFEWDETLGTLVRTLERADLPGVPYVPAGELQTCSGGQLQAVTALVCGDTGGILRQLTEIVLLDTLDGTIRSVYYIDAEANVVTPNVGETFTVGGCPGSDAAAERPEDTPHMSGDIGNFVLGVRNDNAVVVTDADGDYSLIAVDSVGRIGITDLGGSITIDDGGGSITVDGTVNIGTMPEVEIKNDVGNPIPVSDAGGSLTVDGAVSVTNFPAVQPVNDNGGSLTVDGTVAVGPTVTPGTGAANLGKAEDAVHTSGDVGVMALGVRNDNDAVRTSANGDYSPLSTDDTGRLKTTGIVTATPATGGGANIYRNMDVGTAGQVIKGSPGQIYHINAVNRANEEIFLKFYNKATAPTNADVPVLVFPIGTSNQASGEIGISSAVGYAFSLGIGVRASNGIADADNTNTDLNGMVLNVGFK